MSFEGFRSGEDLKLRHSGLVEYWHFSRVADKEGKSRISYSSKEKYLAWNSGAPYSEMFLTCLHQRYYRKIDRHCPGQTGVAELESGRLSLDACCSP